jgi:hypothetical protein
MRHYGMLIVITVLILGSTSCTRHFAPEERWACVVGERCIVEGKLNLQLGGSAWIAILESGDTCAKLALPDDFYADAKQWNGKRVGVTGQVFEQPNFDNGDGTVATWYKRQGRKLELGVCDHGIGIYVESMRTSTGKEWPAK